jgi:hypothetical protein
MPLISVSTTDAPLDYRKQQAGSEPAPLPSGSDADAPPAKARKESKTLNPEEGAALPWSALLRFATRRVRSSPFFLG